LARVEPRSEIERSRILIVDDSATEASEISRYLQRIGLRHQLARTREEAASSLRDARLSGDGYDIVFVPDTMSDSLLALNEGVAVILIRKNPVVDTPPEGAECRFADTIEAPLDAAKVFDALARVSMARRSGGLETAVRMSPPADSITAKTHILVAEDNPINQKVAQRLLEKLGYSVEVAANGREAVQKWAAGSYDLILMDCQMPEMDGYEATREIRSTEAGRRHIPIIALTANAMVGDREKCLSAGMDGFVPKPIRTGVLSDAIKQLLTLSANYS
jgi:CheY-like chemotaxis protein